MPQTVVLMRHARTDWNVQGRLNSTVDIGVNRHGARQAAQAARELARLAPFAFVRSDARRARETAEPLAELVDRDPEVEPRLAEVDFGPFEGHTPAELADDPVFQAWENGHDTGPDGPEGLEVAAQRATAAFRELLDRHADAPTIVVVSHGLLLRALLCRAVLDVPASTYRRFVLDNTRCAVVTVTEGAHNLRLAAMNVSAPDLVALPDGWVDPHPPAG